MKNENIAYAIGIIDNSNNIQFIGWNKETDYYDSVNTDCFSDEMDWCFLEGDVYIYKCETAEQAYEEQTRAQCEFPEKISIIKMIKQDDWWYPDIAKTINEEI